MLLNQTGIRSAGALGMLLVAAGAAYAGALAPQRKAPADSRMSPNQAQRLLAARSARFIENKGQWDSRAKYVARSGGLDLWFTDNGIRYDHHASRSGSRAVGQVVDMFFRDGRPIQPAGRRVTDSRADYYTGKKPALNVRSYRELYAKNVLAGVDMRSYYDGDKPRYDLIVAPGANPKSIKLGFRGTTGLAVKNGELRIGTKLGGFTNGKPFAYQTVGGKQKAVAVRWTLQDEKTATFALGSYDRARPLVIDPVVYGTYFGGDDGGDEVRAITSNTIAGGNNGSVLLTGSTRAVGFPTSTGYYNYNNPTAVDAFISRLQGDAYNRDYAVFFGGQGVDTGQYVKLDAEGNVWIAGTTTSQGFFNATSGVLASSDLFVMRFTLNGNGTLTPTTQNPRLFGSPTAADTLTGFDVLKSTPAVSGGVTEMSLTGITATPVTGVSGSLPTTADVTGYLMKINYQAGTYTIDPSSKYMVGEGGVDNETRGVVYDPSGNVYVVGTAYGSGNQNTDPATGGDPTIFETTPGVFASTANNYDGGRLLRNSDLFVRKYGPSGNLIYSGFVGGSGSDEAGGIGIGNSAGLGVGTDFGVVYTGSAIAVDALGNAYITGVSRSFNFPRTNGVYGEVFDSTAKVIVTKIDTNGSALIYSTNLGTSFGETTAGIAAVAPAGIAVDPQGNAFVTGNLRARRIFFPDTAGDPNQPTSSELPSINIPAGLADVADPTYDSPTGSEFPTSEGFIMVLNPTATNLQYASYLGGILDDFVYAPYVDDNGDVWTMGFTDGHKFYTRVSSTGTVTQYNRFANLPAALISPLALKATPDTNTNTQIPGVVAYPFGYGAFGTDGQAKTPAFVNGAFARDGFIVKIRVNRPNVGSIALSPSTIPGGLGALSNGTVTLSQPAPSGGAQVTVSLPDGTTNASLSPTNPDLGSITLDIAAGATQATFTVYSKPVTVNTSVRVRATYTGTFKESTLQIVPWLVSVTLPQTTAVGGDPNLLRGSVTLAAPAPVGGVDITLTSSSPLARIVNIPFTIAEGQTSATFDIESDGVDADTPVLIQATLLGVTRSANFTLIPANLQSVTLTPDTIAGGSTSVATVTLNGKAGDAPYDVVLTSSDPTVKFLNDSGNEVASITVTIPAQATTTSVGVTIVTVPSANSKSVTITGTHNATAGHPTISRSATLRIQAFSVTTLTLDPTTVDSGGVSNATVTISAAAPTGGTRVYVATSSSTFATVRSSTGATLPTDGIGAYVTVPAGSKTATFQVKARYVGATTSVSITAVASGATKTATLTIRPISYTVSLSPATVTGSATGSNVVTGTVTLATAPTEALTFTVASSNPSVVPDPNPATVTIAAGSKTGTFQLKPLGVTTTTSVTITVSFNGGSKTATLLVKPVGIKSLNPVQRTIRSGTGYLDLDVVFEAPTLSGATLTLSFSLESAFVGPRTVTIPAGTSSYRLHYNTNRLNRSQNVTITATYNDSSAQTVVTVTR